MPEKRVVAPAGAWIGVLVSTILIVGSLTVSAAVQPEAQAGPLAGQTSQTTMASVAADYPIVYVRAPRYGDDTMTRWPEVFDPIQHEPGSDLMLLHPDGSEEVLVAGGNGGVVDPYVSFDGEWVFYSLFPDLRKEQLNYQRRNAPKQGADIYKIHIPSRRIVRLTHQEWTPNTGVANWSEDPVRAVPDGTNTLGYGIFNLGPCPLPGGKVMFTSSRNSFLPNKSYTFPNLQLYVMDDDGSNVELVGHLNLGSALHPTILVDGRVMFSSYEAQGLRDQRMWGLWAIWPDGRNWEPLFSAFHSPSVFHFQTQLTSGQIVVTEYYNLNNNGFGSLLAFPPHAPAGEPPFGSPVPGNASNPRLIQGYFNFPDKPQYTSYSFSPKGLYALTPFTHGRDNASIKDDTGEWMGKVTHPSGGPDDDLLLVWSSGPANHLNRPVNRPVYDGGLYVLRANTPARTHKDLVKILDRPEYNEMQPRALLPFRDMYGVDEPAQLPWLPNDGTEHAALEPGTPFGLVGTSSLYKRNTAPGRGNARFSGLGPFNTSENRATTNWTSQGADSGLYADSEIFAIRLLGLEPTSHRSYGPGGSGNSRGYLHHGAERTRILGEIPVRKWDDSGAPLLDADGNQDTSFLAKIPADVPFTFQTIDEDGLVLNSSQTWHQVRPGEMRADCGGCHAHAQMGMDFETTAAARPDYEVADVSRTTPLLTRDASGAPAVREVAAGAVDVEFYRDIKPILDRSCVGCHSVDGPAEAGLILDDEETVSGGYSRTYLRLASDEGAEHGIKPVIRNGTWRQFNASRYVRKYQARRSLLVWKVFGRRLDGFTNDDHPTERVPGDASTLPEGVNPNDADIDYTGTIMPPPGSKYPSLTADEKMTIARWVDIGAPISSPLPVTRESGWLVDDLRPTLTVSSPRAGENAGPLAEIRIGAFDHYSGLDPESWSVTADFVVGGVAPGTKLAGALVETGDHVWSIVLREPIRELEDGTLSVEVSDQQGNVTRVERRFSMGGGVVEPTPDPGPTVDPGPGPRPTPSDWRPVGVVWLPWVGR